MIASEATGNPAAQVFLTELKKAKFAPRVVGYNQVVDTWCAAATP